MGKMTLEGSGPSVERTSARNNWSKSECYPYRAAIVEACAVPRMLSTEETILKLGQHGSVPHRCLNLGCYQD